MKSTGEVMGISKSFGISFAKSQFASKNYLPLSGTLFMSLADRDKDEAAEIGRLFKELGFKIVATSGTHKVLSSAGVVSEVVLKIHEGRPNVEDLLKNGEISMALNTSDNKSSKDDSIIIRQAVLRFNVPYFTTLAAARVSAAAIKEIKIDGALEPKALQDYLSE